MIPSCQEIFYRVFGAWLLARLDATGAQYFDESPQAALRSFFAALLVEPAVTVTVLFAHGEVPPVGALAVIVVTLLRSEEHTSELQSLMRISYAVFCLKKKKNSHRINQV